MRSRTCVVTLCIIGAAAAPTHPVGAVAAAQRAQSWMESFPVDVKELATEGENPYFILKPGYQLTLEGKEGGQPVQLVITVLPDTVNIGGVETRVVEERETSGGHLVEVSRNFFTIHPRTKDVYYFGEEAVGLRHYQELAPKIAMDRVEIVSVSEKSTTPAGVFDRCVKTRETTPLETFARDYKVYARGIGIVEDGPLKLVSHKYVQAGAR